MKPNGVTNYLKNKRKEAETRIENAKKKIEEGQNQIYKMNCKTYWRTRNMNPATQFWYVNAEDKMKEYKQELAKAKEELQIIRYLQSLHRANKED